MRTLACTREGSVPSMQRRRKAAKLDAELTVLRAKALSEMRPSLSPEQIARLRSAPDETGEIRGERPRAPEPQRDENGLPPKK